MFEAAELEASWARESPVAPSNAGSGTRVVCHWQPSAAASGLVGQVGCHHNVATTNRKNFALGGQS